MRFICAIILILSWSAANGQDLETFRNYFNGTYKLPDIESIKTTNDFIQTVLSPDEIDDKIKAAMSSLLVQNVDVPINLKRLKHFPKGNPVSQIPFDLSSFQRDMPMINKDLEIYNYDGVWLLVSDNSSINLLNIFFAARAIEIIKFKYPEALRYLIKPNQVELVYSRLASGAYLPPTNNFIPIISFDKSPQKIAGSLWNKIWVNSPNKEYNGFHVIENTLSALTSINYETDRPKEIYNYPDQIENYWHYLREGLIESIVHEFTHHYITNFRNFDDKAGYVMNKRYDAADPTFTGDVEEAIVINTTEQYLITKGGLSDVLTSFNLNIKYAGKKAILSDLSLPINKNRFEDLKKFSPSKSESFDQIYKFNFYPADI